MWLTMQRIPDVAFSTEICGVHNTVVPATVACLTFSKAESASLKKSYSTAINIDICKMVTQESIS